MNKPELLDSLANLIVNGGTKQNARSILGQLFAEEPSESAKVARQLRDDAANLPHKLLAGLRDTWIRAADILDKQPRESHPEVATARPEEMAYLASKVAEGRKDLLKALVRQARTLWITKDALSGEYIARLGNVRLNYQREADAIRNAIYCWHKLAIRAEEIQSAMEES